ncbi:MAG: YdeI/OmpD-associated family protein [Acidimicrobiales bacterium]
MADQPGVSFSTHLHAVPGKSATGIVVPPEVIEQLGGGKKPAVMVTVNGYKYQTTIGVMAGNSMIPVSAAIRKDAGLAAGDSLEVSLVLATGPRSFEMPADFADALAANPPTADFFASLSNSVQRYHVDNIAGAKAAETRQRRIDKAVALFLEGKQR